MKKVVLLLSLIVSVLVLSSCSWFGIPIDEEHFPDYALRSGVWALDSNKNGYLSKKEVEEATKLNIWLTDNNCYDLSGIEYLPNLETLLIIRGSDLSGIENLTNLKSLTLCDCSNISGIDFPADLEELAISDCVFTETFVFDSDTSVTDIKFGDCVFEKGIIFKNNSVENVTFDDCAVCGDVIFADCDGLKNFEAGFRVDKLYIDADYSYLKEQSYNIDLSGCDNLDCVDIENGQEIASVDLSNCNMLRTIWIHDLFLIRDNISEFSLNISGCPNVEKASFGLLGLSELDISDCPHLISASEQTPTGEYILEYESEDGYIYTANENLVFIK